ncbi:MAG: hypothetical protein ACI92G_002713 [Candidatus Pelagisphaera sp.]|jgi:hypothetical protein
MTPAPKELCDEYAVFVFNQHHRINSKGLTLALID